jgi:uncharacterized membrane protein (UPF0182 family)
MPERRPTVDRREQTTQLGRDETICLADQDQTLQQSIQQLVGSAPPPPTTGAPPPKTFNEAQTAQIADLVTQTNANYKAAYVALAKGDFTTFATEMQAVGRLLDQLQAITGTSSAPVSASPSPKASPSPTR